MVWLRPIAVLLLGATAFAATGAAWAADTATPPQPATASPAVASPAVASPAVAFPAAASPRTETILGQTLVIPVLPQPNGYDALVDAIGALAPARRLPPAVAREVTAKRQLVQESAMALVGLRQALAMPSRVPIDDQTPANRRSLAGFRRLTTVLLAEADVRQADRDFLGAADACLDVLLLAQTVSRGGPLMNTLASTALEEPGYAALWQLLPKLSAEQSRDVLFRLQTIEARRPALADTLRAEERVTLQRLDTMLSRARWDRASRAARRNFLQRRMGVTNPEIFLNATTTQIGAAVRGIIEAKIAALEQAPAPEAAPLPTPEFPAANLFREQLGPGLESVQGDVQRARTRAVLLAVGLAMRAYEKEKGALPDTLEQLAPEYLPTLPADPFAPDGPLHYHHNGGQFKLYSVGPDGDDDDRQRIRSDTDTDDDMVAPLSSFQP